MLKNFLGFAVLISVISCNVRKQDNISPVINTDSVAVSSSLTTVQVLDSSYNFGKIIDGQSVEFSYRFKNTGVNPLIITDATASCGCTVPEKPEQPILPGEIGYLKVKFNSENRPGIAHKSVTVTANVEGGFPELMLLGEVLPKEKKK